MIPPERKMVEASTVDTPAVFRLTRRSRANKNAITTVANTSKNPSTQRCTTHQRQYSATARFVVRP